MQILKRILTMVLVLAFVLVPLASCSAQLKLPKEEKKEEVVKLSYGEKLRQSIEVDPLFGDASPLEDEEMNILFIGNSYSYYWPAELAELLGAAGYENVLVCNIYHSGASFEDHWTWMQNGEKVEDFFINVPGEAQKKWSDVGFEECVTYANWDYISFQQTNRYAGSEYKNSSSISRWLPDLFSYVYAYFPEADYYWHQSWAHSAGKGSYSGTSTTDKMTKFFSDSAKKVCANWEFTNAPCGDAWVFVRYDPLFYAHSGDYENDLPTKSLHTRIQHSGTNKGEIINSDLSHDGDIGGGQYLNACVWFETITKKSVIGNSYVPVYLDAANNKEYTFTAEQVAKLQDAAHRAVLEYHGEEFYK